MKKLHHGIILCTLGVLVSGGHHVRGKDGATHTKPAAQAQASPAVCELHKKPLVQARVHTVGPADCVVPSGGYMAVAKRFPHHTSFWFSHTPMPGFNYTMEITYCPDCDKGLKQAMGEYAKTKTGR